MNASADDEAIRTVRRRAAFFITFPSAVAICFGLDNGSCAPLGTILLAPILFGLFLPAADIIATFARGTPRFTMPISSTLYRIAVVALPIICFATARALAHPAVPTACLP